MNFKNNRMSPEILSDENNIKDWKRNVRENYSMDLNENKEWQEYVTSLNKEYKNSGIFSFAPEAEDRKLLENINESIIPQSQWWSKPRNGPFDWMRNPGKIFAPLKWLVGLTLGGLGIVLFLVAGALKAGRKGIAVKKLKNYLNRLVVLADGGWKNKKHLTCLLKIERSSRKQILIQSCELLKSAGFELHIDTENKGKTEKDNTAVLEESADTSKDNVETSEHIFTESFNVPKVEGIDWSLLNREHADSGWLNWGILLPFKNRLKSVSALQMIENVPSLEKAAFDNADNDVNRMRNNYVTSLASVYAKSLYEVMNQQTSTVISKDIKNQLINMSKNSAAEQGRPEMKNGGKSAPNETNFFESWYSGFKKKLFEDDNPQNNANQQNAQQQNTYGQSAGNNTFTDDWANNSKEIWVVCNFAGQNNKKMLTLNQYLQSGQNFNAVVGIMKYYNSRPDSVKFDLAHIFNPNTKTINTAYFQQNPRFLSDFLIALQTGLPAISTEIGISNTFKGFLQTNPVFNAKISRIDKDGANYSKIASDMDNTIETKKEQIRQRNSESKNGYVGFSQRESQIFSAAFKEPQNLNCFQYAHKQMEVFLTQFNDFIVKKINRVVPDLLNQAAAIPKYKAMVNVVAKFFYPNGFNGATGNGLTMLWSGNYYPELQKRMETRASNVISSKEMEFYRQITEFLIPQIIEKATTSKLTSNTSMDMEKLKS